MHLAAFVAVVAAVSQAAEPPAAPAKKSECVIRIGPRDRVAKDETIMVKDGESLDAVVAIRGDVVVQRGGRVVKAVALGGSVSVEGGAVVVQNAVAVGGDVKLAQGARVDKDAMALGGQVRSAPGARVAGAVIGLSLQLGQDLQSKFLSELQAEGSSCRIERETR